MCLSCWDLLAPRAPVCQTYSVSCRCAGGRGWQELCRLFACVCGVCEWGFIPLCMCGVYASVYVCVWCLCLCVWCLCLCVCGVYASVFVVFMPLCLCVWQDDIAWCDMTKLDFIWLGLTSQPDLIGWPDPTAAPQRAWADLILLDLTLQPDLTSLDPSWGHWTWPYCLTCPDFSWPYSLTWPYLIRPDLTRPVLTAWPHLTWPTLISPDMALLDPPWSYSTWPYSLT